MIFLKALVFGATLAVAIGPVALLVIGYAARHGLRAGVASAAGAASGDLTYALVALTVGSRVLPELTRRSNRIQTGADLVLIGFGLWMAWCARREATADPVRSDAATGSVVSAFRTTYALTVVNPLTVVAFMAFVPQLGMNPGSELLAASAGLFAGSLAVQIGIASGGSILHRIMRPPRIRALNVLSAAGIVAFGCIDLLR